MGKTSIQWTDATWNPVRGCSRISPGCEHCYAETMAARFSGKGQWAHGFALRSPARWTRKVELVPHMLELPLHWKKPRRIFVNSMSDLFHENLLPEEIGRVFEVMEKCPQHTFQILTKRADVLRNYMQIEYATEPPPANVWLGVSVEDQARADQRIPLLLQTPAAVRFLSVEPLLGPVSFRWAPWAPMSREHDTGHLDGLRGIGWVIVGGESGHGARPFALAWARTILEQCSEAGVKVFVKQLGENPIRESEDDRLWNIGISRKGGDPSEWPVDLRVREFPT